MLKKQFISIIQQLRTKAFGWKSQYEIDVPESLKFMNRIKEPVNDIERS